MSLMLNLFLFILFLNGQYFSVNNKNNAHRIKIIPTIIPDKKQMVKLL